MIYENDIVKLVIENYSDIFACNRRHLFTKTYRKSDINILNDLSGCKILSTAFARNGRMAGVIIFPLVYVIADFVDDGAVLLKCDFHVHSGDFH